ncbi:MAG TPA: globin domain-containing protein [Kofleriaceae bacterium]
MALNVALLRDSFTLVATINPKITTRFYEILFERYPQTQAMFPIANRPRQAEMLTGALVAVMDHLEDAPWLTDTLGALGAKHADYGVTREMYDWVGASLLAALAETAGDKWSSELNSAWTEAYGAIVSLMTARVA